jgi:hypothetical protein
MSTGSRSRKRNWIFSSTLAITPESIAVCFRCLLAARSLLYRCPLPIRTATMLSPSASRRSAASTSAGGRSSTGTPIPLFRKCGICLLASTGLFLPQSHSSASGRAFGELTGIWSATIIVVTAKKSAQPGYQSAWPFQNRAWDSSVACSWKFSQQPEVSLPRTARKKRSHDLLVFDRGLLSASRSFDAISCTSSRASSRRVMRKFPLVSRSNSVYFLVTTFILLCCS